MGRGGRPGTHSASIGHRQHRGEHSGHPRGAGEIRGAGGDGRHVARDYATIQSAVDAAEEGDTILVGPGVYSENVVVSTSGVQLRGAGDVVLDGTSLNGIGIHVLGAPAAPVTGVEVTHFEVGNFERGIIAQLATGARVSHNHVHDNVDKVAPAAHGDGTGIELGTTRSSVVSYNVVTHNGLGGIQLRVGSTDNTIRHNRIQENGSQSPTLDGVGVLLTGAGTNDNRIQYKEILGSLGARLAAVSSHGPGAHHRQPGEAQSRARQSPRGHCSCSR